MSVRNNEILKERILMLLKEKNITQTYLAQEIGMTQSNLSKRLSPNNDQSNHFTIDQVWAIADYFNVSVDYLLGRKIESTIGTPENICRFLMSLCDSDTIEFTKFDKTETYRHHIIRHSHYFPDYIDSDVHTVYYGFVFPEYYPADKYTVENEENFAEGIEYSNLRPVNKKINQFWTNYLMLKQSHDSGMLDDDVFQIAVEALLKKMES